MDVAGLLHKQLGEKDYCYVMINAPMTCLTLNRLQSMIVGRETSIQTKIWFIAMSLLALARQSADEIVLTCCLHRDIILIECSTCRWRQLTTQP